ncbi:hypothetical protein GR223_12050 [Rhizobium leguminosarum]|uniref:hypothetical protein n=1 Tax=Rhizobium ruizarguesonis TaxID=2081791 RepID=UPI0013DEAA8D|nr:hypothetical protein [Rhizobium ruizarguesonis]NEJ86663.1 hypothetical protein [Rhizobium ruizarguesonis]
MIEQTDDSAIVARLCVEQWKLLQRFSKAIELVPDGDRNRLASQIRYSELQLQSLAAEAGLKLITFDGELFGPGCPATADNLEDFSDEEGLIVEKPVEPAVVRDMRILQSGRVLLAIQN